MKTNTNTNAEAIYEKAGVYGDIKKFSSANHRFEKMIQLIKEMKLKKAKVLDLGCGTGYLAAQVKDIFPEAEVHGTDISAQAINEGKKLYKKIILTVSNSEGVLPYKHNYFDFIISGEHIAHLKNTDIYLEEINRILKPKGTLMLTTPNLVSWFNRILFIFGKAPFFFEPLLHTGVPIVSIAGMEFPPKEMLPSGHLRLFNLDMLKKILAINNITVQKTYGVSALNNAFIKPIDVLLTVIPDLASGIIVIGQKNK